MTFYTWIIEPADVGYVSIQSASSKWYLDSRSTEHEAYVGSRNSKCDKYLNWTIGEADGIVKFRCKSNGHYIDGRDVAGATAFLTGGKNPVGDHFLQRTLENA